MNSLNTPNFNLPTPLSKEENNELFIEFFNGDLLARDKLIIHNQRLAFIIAQKYATNSYEMEEYFCEGIIGLVKAVDTYNNEKIDKFSFSSYAYACINNQILLLMRYERRKTTNPISLETFFIDIDPEDKNLSLLDCVKDEDENLDEQLIKEENYTALYKSLDVLSSQEREVVIKMYGLQDIETLKATSPFDYRYGTKAYTNSQRIIGKMLNMSRTKVSYIHKSALKKLHNSLKDKIDM